jgi:VIT1/CCC1 family predicted Fe2+/Mn2+ transporter
MSVYSTDNIGHPIPQTLSDVGRHHKNLDKSGSLRAGIFGVNDGLISNTGLILGMLGAASSHHVVVISGIAGLIAGSFSMAAGEYVSMLSQREMFEYQIDLERKELEQYPNEEAEELALIYEARGIPKEDARKMAFTLMQDPVKALDILAKEELGLDPEHLGSPLAAAISSFISFSIGAFIPLYPFILEINSWHLGNVIVLSGISLFIVGMLISLFTGKNALISGLRMFIIGCITGLITYSVGYYFGGFVK